MVKKEMYQEVESKLLLAESEIRELKFTMQKIKKRLNEVNKIFLDIDIEVK